jgi:peptidoglycan-associated lipoprotein
MQEKVMKFAVTQLQTPPARSTRALVFFSLGLAALAGCHHKTAPVNPASTAPTPAPTANLTADPLAVDLGQSVVLNWRTTDATSVSIDGIGPVAVNGTQTVTPSTSTNFHLVAKGDGGAAEANVRVTVRVPTTPTTPTTDNSGAGDASADKIFHQNVPDIFFDYDSYSLRPDGQTAAQKAAAYLAAHPEIKIVIGGYCDERGSAEYNLALGENRANSAKTALVNDGLAASRIRVVSFGKEKQFCSDATEACYQQNRRAQFSLDR